ncbi:hypothetical protein [Pseudomonas lurida]|uniref:hypothetical protein n=1 Tax=Pseudomonas lurida TaxID=244566 RepID=UPI0027348D2D|nr:hypothetical protein [Pseudomonas lurida]WLG27164.1 hypothetical protein PSH68_20480 [Pseudomonas lurida]
MLVYANKFEFEPEYGAEEIIQVIAAWAGKTAKAFVEPERLMRGTNFSVNGYSITSWSTVNEEGAIAPPLLFNFRFVHQDSKFKGRQWITEVGVRQREGSEIVECTVLLKTDEVSARVVAPIKVTRPGLVTSLVERCRPVSGTPGLFPKKLNFENASAFLAEIEHESRYSPLVVVSAKDGQYPVNPESIRKQVLGLANVICIPEDEDTFKLEEIVGRRYMSFSGVIRIIFPPRYSSTGRFIETALLRPDEFPEKGRDALTLSSEVLALITHRSNVSLQRAHISNEAVRFEVLRGKLGSAAAQARSDNSSAEVKVFAELLEAADEDLATKKIEIEELNKKLEDCETDLWKAESAIVSLKHRIEGRQAVEDDEGELSKVFLTIREAHLNIKNGSAVLFEVLSLIGALYVDRIVVLDSAYSSAVESDKANFKYSSKAYELLETLATSYWQLMADGQGDQQAKSVFGNSFTANEASLSKEGRKRRTFEYRGQNIFMDRHLKYGVKDSASETLRIHFDWSSSEKKLIIGHCGKHLDF